MLCKLVRTRGVQIENLLLCSELFLVYTNYHELELLLEHKICYEEQATIKKQGYLYKRWGAERPCCGERQSIHLVGTILLP